jgi:hypothetical protein
MFSTNGISYYKCYSVAEVGLQIKRSEKIIFAFIKDGLKTIDDKKPFLIRGYDLIAYLRKINERKKCPTEIYEMYCPKCREARTPKAKEITIEPDFGIKAKGICPVCKITMNKNYKIDSLSDLKRIFHIVDKLCISDSDNPAVNFQIKDQNNNPENGNTKEQLCLPL